MAPNIDRLAYADCAHVEDELRARARGEELPLPLAHPAHSGARPACACCDGVASTSIPVARLSPGELDALHFRFWSADHKRFDHLGFAYAVMAACARHGERRRVSAASNGSRPDLRRA